MSIISTRSNNQSANLSTTTITDINSGDIVVVEAYDGSDNPSVKWNVSIIETVTLQTYAFDIFAVHNFSNDAVFSRTNILGEKMVLIIAVTYGAGNIINLSIANNEANPIRVFTKKI